MNPEQHVIDEIDRLVDWQIEEGRKRESTRPPGVLLPYFEMFATPVHPDDLARALEAERRAQIIEDGRARWGRGYKLVYDSEENLTAVFDDDGHPVPAEDWGAFQAYHAAMFDYRMAAARSFWR